MVWNKNQSKATGGKVPFTFKLASEKDPSKVYIRVQGIDPSNNFQACFITFKETNGHPIFHYMHDIVDTENSEKGLINQNNHNDKLRNNTSITKDISSGDSSSTLEPAQYCQVLSKLPNTVQIPFLLSASILVSIDEPLNEPYPDRLDIASPDYNTQWNQIDLSSSKTDGISVNFTAADSFGSPSIALQMSTAISIAGRKVGKERMNGPTIGYSGDPASLLEEVKYLINVYAGLGSIGWDNLFYNFASLDRITAPKLDSTFDHYYDKYLEQSFLPYYMTRDLHVHTRAATLRGRVDDDLEYFEFYDKADNLVASLPTFTDDGSTRGWLTGELEDWPGGLGDYTGSSGIGSKQVLADLAKNLSCFINSGIGQKMTTWDKPISKEYFQQAAKHGKMFQQTYAGQPMYDLYERVMYEAGFNGYTSEHSDYMFGRDGPQEAKHAQSPAFNIVINF